MRVQNAPKQPSNPSRSTNAILLRRSISVDGIYKGPREDRANADRIVASDGRCKAPLDIYNNSCATLLDATQRNAVRINASHRAVSYPARLDTLGRESHTPLARSMSVHDLNSHPEDAEFSRNHALKCTLKNKVRLWQMELIKANEAAKLVASHAKPIAGSTVENVLNTRKSGVVDVQHKGGSKESGSQLTPINSTRVKASSVQIATRCGKKLYFPTTVLILLGSTTSAGASLAIAIGCYRQNKNVSKYAQIKAEKLRLLRTINHSDFGDGYDNRGQLTAE